MLNYTFSTFSIIYFGITALLTSVAIIIFTRRNSLSGRMLASFMVSVAIWTFTGAFDMASTSLEGKILWSKIQYIGIYTTPGFLFLFIYYFYFNNSPLSKLRLLFLWFIPFLTIVFAFTNEWHSLIWIGFSASTIPNSNLIIYHHGYWFWFAFLYYYGLLLTSIIFLVRGYRKFSGYKKKNALLILIAFPFPIIGNILYNFNLGPWSGFDLTAVGFTISSIFLYWGVRRQNLVDLAPIAREKLFDTVEEGVLILNQESIVVDHNQAIVNIIRRKGYELRKGVLNRTANELMQEMPDLIPVFESERGYPFTINAITVDEPTLEINQQLLLNQDNLIIGRLILVRDVTKQKQAEQQLLWQQRMLAADQERQKLGQELHDNLAQVLGYINLQSKTILKLIEDGDITMAVSTIGQLINVSQDATNDVRGFIEDSRKEITLQKGFLSALQSYIDSFQQLSNIPVKLSFTEIDLDSITNTKIRLQILRIIQEALSNARKHARANEIQIIFSQNPEHLFVTIKDNGKGFNPDQTNLDGHFGLKIMKERASEAGGKILIFSEPGKGTTIQLKIPFDKTAGLAELRKIDFMVVDDHPLFVDGIKNLLTAKGLKVIETAKNGEEALEKLKNSHPGIILIDAHLPGLSGQDTTKIIKQLYPDIKVLMMTMSDRTEDLQAAIESGVNGYVLKNQSPEELFKNLTRILHEPLVISTEMTKKVLERRNLSSESQIEIKVPAAIFELSAVELDILERVAKGEGYKEIGSALNLSPHTIKYHFNKVLNKLEIDTRGEAIHLAIQAGLIKGKRHTDQII